MKKRRRKFSVAFKVKVVIEALKEQMTIQELSSKYEIHPNQVSTCKSEFMANATTVFDPKISKPKNDTEKLYKIIGHQKVEIDFLTQISMLD